jgi:hypothetical protein
VICSEPECDRVVVARGMCRKHYNHLHRAGLLVPVRRDAESRFWAKVECRGPDECWRFGGFIVEGYGRFVWPGGQLAHRFAYELLIGPIPLGMEVDHVCHTRDANCRLGKTCPHRACCNPAHLQAVTHVENGQRAHRPKGNQHGRQVACKNGHLLSGDNLRIELGGRRRCLTCKRNYAKTTRSNYGQHKRKASQAITNAVAAGKIVRGPCEVCGVAGGQGHHDDYDKPLEVRWLCPTHHAAADQARRSREALCA